MNPILQTTIALDEFMPETTAAVVEPESSGPVFELSTRGMARSLEFSVRKCHWLVSTLAILFAGYSGLENLREPQGAPQQMAGAAATLLIAIVPYLFARSIDELTRS